MGWFGRRSRVEHLLEGILAGNNALERRLTAVEARAETSPQPTTSPGTAEALVGVCQAMAHTLSTALSKQTEMADKMLERSYRREVSSVAGEMGRRGREARMKKEREAKEQAEQITLDIQKVKECEECAAQLEGRTPRHADHLYRHNLEKHAALVLPLCNHANGQGN